MSGDAGDQRPVEDRAEELVDEWARQAARSLSLLLARGREELEDIWAEAQQLRRGESSSPPPG
jgi:hypothetical protein